MPSNGSVKINIELEATPDVLTHIARVTEAALAVDGVMTVRRSPTAFPELLPPVEGDNGDAVPVTSRSRRS